MRVVAERAGVSTATVSNVLTGKASVTTALAARVRAVVEELGYVADGSASRLRSGKQALAGVVVPDLANPFFGAFVSTLEHAARDDGFDLLVVSSANDPAQERERLHKIRSWRPAGLIVVPCDGELLQRRPAAAQLPIVAVDRIPDCGTFDLIAVDNSLAAGAIAAHCAAEGFASCLVAGSTLSISNVRERWEGVVAAAGPMRVSVLESGLERQVIRRRLLLRLGQSPRPEMLFTLDDITTLVAYQLLGELGLRIPHDMGFASFDESEWMRLVVPGVTAVCQPVEAMAAAAWRRLKQRMEGDASAPSLLRLSCAIEIRGSTLRHQSTPHQAAAQSKKTIDQEEIEP